MVALRFGSNAVMGFESSYGDVIPFLVEMAFL